MSSKRKAEPSKPTTTKALPPSCIGEFIDRMTRDADEINRRLLRADLSMIGETEPELFKIITRIQADLALAREVWKF